MLIDHIVFAFILLLGLGCTTVLAPETAALQAVQILSLHDHVIWAKLRARALNTWVGLKQADAKLSDDR